MLQIRKMIRKKRLNRMVSWVERADDLEINEIVQAVIRRYGKVFPDWEIVFLSLPKNDPNQRRQTLEYMMKLENRR